MASYATLYVSYGLDINMYHPRPFKRNSAHMSWRDSKEYLLIN